MIPALLLLGLSALVGETGLGCCQKHTGNSLQKAMERRFAVRPEAPFLHSSVRSCVAEGPQLLYKAACCPHRSFKPAHLEDGTETKRVTDVSPLDFPS